MTMPDRLVSMPVVSPHSTISLDAVAFIRLTLSLLAGLGSDVFTHRMRQTAV